MKVPEFTPLHTTYRQRQSEENQLTSFSLSGVLRAEVSSFGLPKVRSNILTSNSFNPFGLQFSSKSLACPLLRSNQTTIHNLTLFLILHKCLSIPSAFNSPQNPSPALFFPVTKAQFHNLELFPLLLDCLDIPSIQPIADTQKFLSNTYYDNSQNDNRSGRKEEAQIMLEPESPDKPEKEEHTTEWKKRRRQSSKAAVAIIVRRL